MIRVAKPVAPAKLTQGEPLTLDNCNAYDIDPAPYDSGALSFEISSAIYGHALVKDVLRAAQRSKCCYCEGIFEANAAADVEHYRPKKYVQQGRRTPKLYPGYYWLGYRWENLYYSCQVCNRSRKKNYFPLRNPATRVRNHHGNLADEEALILDPGGHEDPRNHIRFHDEVAVGITDCGRSTVDYVGLNRNPLVEERLGRFNELSRLRDVINLLAGSANPDHRTVAENAFACLQAAVLPPAKFSAMASDFLQGTGVA